MHRSDFIGRIVGIVVFLGGIALLVFVFVLAYGFFTSAGNGLAPVHSSGGAVQPAATQLGREAVRLFVQIGLLIVMTIIGSLLAGRGIQLYFAAARSNVGQE